MPVSRPDSLPRRIGYWIGFGLFVLITALGAAWSAIALSFHLTGPVLWATLGALGLATLAALALRWHSRRRGWAVLLVADGRNGTAANMAEAERLLAGMPPVMGVVLNKSDD